MRRAVLLLALASCVLALPALVGAQARKPAAKPVKPRLVAAALVKGQPNIEPGKHAAVYVWTDPTGFHLRWVNDGQPRLFAGRLDFDKPLKEHTRVLGELGSGWVEQSGDRIVMFSTTLREGVDGLDLNAPGAARVQLELKIEGEDARPDQVFLGVQGAHPEGLPLIITTR
jgi:hypothetical protein